MKLGIIQGRLSPPDEGWQETPTDWRKEFRLLDELGLNHVEWIVTDKPNPIFHEDVSEFRINTICADVLVTEKIFESDFLRDTLVPICETARKNNIAAITIPLLEDSSVVDEDKRDAFLEKFLPIVDEYHDLYFSIEAELDPHSLLEIVELRWNLYVTYDTGNTTSFGYDHDKALSLLGRHIDSVHLKDRTRSNETVKAFTGDTDFGFILAKLKEIGYDGLYSIQTCREEEGREVKTIKKQTKEFRSLL